MVKNTPWIFIRGFLYLRGMVKTDTRLKKFIEDNIPVDALRKVKFFPKGMRRNDYDAMAARICLFFGYDNIYQYLPPDITLYPEANCGYGKFPDTIDSNGEIKTGAGFHIETGQSEFICPHCECEQEAKDNNKAYFNQKCKGCKRKLTIAFDHIGNIYVFE